MITVRIGVLVLTVYHFPQYCEGVLNLQPSMGAEESICYNNCTHNSPRRCVMVIILFGEWNARFQVSFPVYYHLPLLGPCLHAATSSHCQNTIQSWMFHSLCPQLWGFSLVSLSYYEATLQSVPVYKKIPHLG